MGWAGITCTLCNSLQDGDGWVSHEDYRIAKKFDLDNNGILDREERELAKEMLVQEFISENDNDLQSLSTLGGKMKRLEQTIRSPETKKLLTLPQTIKAINAAKFSIKYSTANLLAPDDSGPNLSPEQRYFTNKMDSTAWNDLDAVPRASSTYGLHDHGGSRKRLFFSRKQRVAEDSKSQLEAIFGAKPQVDARRSQLITNYDYENA